MSQDTKPAPFNVGDHVCYVGAPRRAMPDGQGKEMSLALTPGMIGVIDLSTGALSEEGAVASKPWRCQAQFTNGFQLDITPENCGDVEMTTGPGTARV